MDINGSDGIFCYQKYSAIGDAVYVMWIEGKDFLTINGRISCKHAGHGK
jgi:hypothetical protein